MIGIEGTRLICIFDRNSIIRAHARVDEQDYDTLVGYRWHLNGRYAMRSENAGGNNKSFSMHRQIMGVERGDPRQVDHINRIKLDNRRANLRILTQAQNMQNLDANATSTSPYRGVSWDTEAGKWRAVGYVDGRIHHLGRFSDERLAARVAANWRAEHMPFSEEALLRVAA